MKNTTKFGSYIQNIVMRLDNLMKSGDLRTISNQIFR